MKRCPQCEFIYEDDQSLCDMDGALLVFDSRSLPNLHALAPVDVPIVAKAHWRHRTFPAMAGLILATILSLAYFVSSQRTAQMPAPLPIGARTVASSSTTAVSDVNQTPPAAPAEAEVNAAAADTKDKEEPKPETTKSTTSRAAVPAAKKPVNTATVPERKPEEPKKEDSKVGSILKKTGHILKKPFKF